MQFLLLICVNDGFDPPDSIGADTNAWVSETNADGVRTAGDRLVGAADATTVRVRDGQVNLIKGSEVDLRGAIVGFDLIVCEDLDAAIEVVARHPMAKAGTIEIRSVWSD